VRAYRQIHGESWDNILVAEAGFGSLDDLEHFSHPSVVIAPKTSIVGANIVSSLFTNNAGHTKLLIVHNPGQGTGITAVMDNEVTVKKGDQIPLLFGAFQKGAALAIDYCIMAGILPQDVAVRAKLVIGVEAYLDPKATLAERVQDNAMAAIIDAIVIATTGGISPEGSAAACASQHVFSDVTPLPAPVLG
jgi:formaldehyde-activating enzyme